MNRSLTGQLLVAAPALRGSTFDRAVVLMLSHDGDGALGVMVNRPTDVLVGDVLPAWMSVVSEPGVVFQGGPVSLDSALGLVAVDGADEPLGVRRVRGRLGVVDLDTPAEIIEPAVSAMRVFAGYAGWAPDQVEGEIEEGSWFVVDAEPGDAFRTDAEDMWALVLRRQGGQLALMATFPADPSLN
ncbi:YqgE/AlgH family protein [Jiangella gansuensis]|uniref:YqgE/AlgH family protein n=1 Tax=Jiangella gansuensis TaxID=281473 RepID=UPI00047B90B3|nr:YqgE/AlgH family protein [Jiangella gansuensis]